MPLTCTILRCPDAVPPETRRVNGGEFSIGRGPDNDWVLPDPDRHLSKRHCVLAFRSGGWQLADLSTNGTFLNRETEAVGAGRPRAVHDGDRLRLGPYEIELRIEEAEDFARGARQADLDPFADAPPRAPGGNPFEHDPLLEPRAASRGGIGLPADYDPLAAEPETPFGGPAQADHSPAVEDAFRPPRPSANLLPDDWDLDLGPRAAPLDPAPPPAPMPVAAAPPQIPVAPPVPLPVPAAAPAEDGALLAAFLRGAQMAGRPADAAAMMEALGRAFRALVAGLREALIARATVKGEFRIEQTMIRARGNNPLKFSASDDDALDALLGIGRRIEMEAADAVADALRDMRLHELATMAAMQSAVRAMLAELDPAALRRAAEQGGLALVPAQRKARAWDAFEALHGRISQALSDDFDSVFGKAFARAYERALQDVSEKEKRS